MSKLRLLIALLFPALLALIIYAIKPTFSSSVYSLLPQTNISENIATLIEQRNKTFKNTLVVLLEEDTDSPLRLREQAALVVASADASQLFSDIEWQKDADEIAENYALMKPYRAAFLSAEQRQSSPNWVIQQWYSPSANSTQLLQDPLLLNSGLQSLLLAQASDVTLIDSVPILNRDNKNYILIKLSIAPNNQSIEGSAKVESWLGEVKKALVSGRLYSLGVSRYSHAAVEQARDEVSSIGLVSLVAIVLLVLFIFRSPFVLVAVFYPLVVAILGGTLVLSLCFESIHLLTLVFGASLLGLSVDYAFHWLLCYQKKTPVVLARTLLAAGVSSVTVFLAQTLTSFEVLAQMGVFAASGIFLAATSVVILYPWIFKTGIGTTSAECFSKLPKLRVNSWWVPLLILICLGLVWQQKVDDDVRKLQPVNAELQAEEHQIQSVFSQNIAPAYIYINAPDECQLIAKAHDVAAILHRANIEYNRALIDYYPRCEQQLKNIEVAKSWGEEDGLYQMVASSLPIQTRPSEAYRRELAELELLTLSSPVPEFISSQLQWMKTSDGRSHGLVSLKVLSAEQSSTIVPQLAPLSAVYVDQVSQLNRALGQARYRGGSILVATLLLLGCGLLLLFRKQQPWLRTIPILVGFCAALGATWLLAQPFSVFTLLALVMLVGLSMDFSIFSAQGEQCALLAIVCSALTTILAFGTLGLSEVPVLHNIGTVLTFGILGAMASSLLIRD